MADLGLARAFQSGHPSGIAKNHLVSFLHKLTPASWIPPTPIYHLISPATAMTLAFSPISGPPLRTPNTPHCPQDPGFFGQHSQAHQLSLSRCSYAKPFRSLRTGHTPYLPPVPLFILPPISHSIGQTPAHSVRPKCNTPSAPMNWHLPLSPPPSCTLGGCSHQLSLFLLLSCLGPTERHRINELITVSR